MEQQQQEEVVVPEAETSLEEGSSSEQTGDGPAKRTPRMLHEASFATSTLTSGGGSRRPPGFGASSLDYKVQNTVPASWSSNVGADENPVNPKPVKRKIQPQQQDAEHQDDQQQSAKPKKPSLPTRAKGNYGPPPHQITSLEDLEQMSEDQLYKLFMEDPELYRSLLKSNGEGGASSNSGSGSRRARSSDGARSSGSSNKRTLPVRVGDDAKVPYLQWLLVLALLGALLYQLRKTIASDTGSSGKAKRGAAVAASTGVAKSKGGKQKKQKQKNEKAPLTVIEKDPGKEKATKRVPKPAKAKSTAGKATTSSVPRNKKPPKETKASAKEVVVAATPVATAKSSVPRATPAVNQELSISVTGNEGDDGAWQTVAKSRGTKLDSNTASPTAPAPVPSAPMNGTSERSHDVATSMNSQSMLETPKNGSEAAPANGLTANGNEKEKASSTTNKKKKKKKNNKANGTSANGDGAPQGAKTTSTDNDAALAFHLQRQEEILANAETNPSAPAEEAWEEVTSKKKKE